MELDLLKIDGTQTGTKVALPDDIFNVEPNDHAIYLAVCVQMTNSRQGTVGSKNRRLITGGGKKPWRQKGRGTARAGTSRSPLWVGGARIFGPQMRDYHSKINKKVKKLARCSALTYKARQNEILVVEDFDLQNPKTRELYRILEQLSLAGKKVLLVVPRVVSTADNKILRAGRNIPNLAIRVAGELSTLDILNSKTLLMQQSSIGQIETVL